MAASFLMTVENLQATEKTLQRFVDCEMLQSRDGRAPSERKGR
jgi:hypothetical protein